MASAVDRLKQLRGETFGQTNTSSTNTSGSAVDKLKELREKNKERENYISGVYPRSFSGTSATNFDGLGGGRMIARGGRNEAETSADLKKRDYNLSVDIGKKKWESKQELGNKDSAYKRATSAKNQIDYLRSVSAFDPGTQVDKILRQYGFNSEDEMRQALTTSATAKLAELRQERRDLGAEYFHTSSKEAVTSMAGNNAYRQAVEADANNDRKAKDEAVQKLIDAGFKKDDIDRALYYEERLRDEQKAAETQQKLYEFANKNLGTGVASFVGRTGLTAVQGLDYITALAKSIGHSDLDNLDRYRPISSADLAITGAKQALESGVTDQVRREIDNPIVEELAVFGLQIGMSVADSVTFAKLGGATVAGVILGSAAAASTTKDAVDRGATNAQALALGAAAGVAESFFEKYSLDKAIGDGISVKARKDIFKHALQQAGIEASEEMATEVTNILVDAAIMAGNSNSARAKRQYMEQGMSESEANQRVLLDSIKSVGLAGLSGAVSGGLTGGFFGTSQYNQHKAAQKQSQLGQVMQAVDKSSAKNEAAQQTPAIEQKPTQESAPVQPGVVSPQTQESAQSATVADSAKVGDFGKTGESFVADRPQVGYTKTNTEVNANGEGVHLRNGSQWDGSENPGGQVPAMEGSAGQTESRYDEGRPADDGTASFTYGAKVSTRALLGVDNASANRNLRVVTGGDSVHTQAARQMAKERGLDLVLFSGGNLSLIDKNGYAFEARAYIIGNKMYVRADHGQFTADQLTKHEIGHDMIAKGEIDPNTVRDRIGAEQADRISQMYAEAYQGSDLTADEIWEEVICDSIAGMNIFSGLSTGTEAGAVLNEMGRAAESDGSAEGRGPPETDTKAGGKASREVDREFQINFSGTVIADRYVRLSDVEKKAIASAIKSGNARMDDDGGRGSVNAGAYCYLFNAFSDGDAFVTDKVDHATINIHDNHFGQEATYGKTGWAGNRGTVRNAGGSRGKLSHGTEHLSESSARATGNDQLVGEKSGGERVRDVREVGGTEQDPLIDITYGPDYAYWRNTMKDGNASRETTPAAELTDEQRAALSATQEVVRSTVREELDRMGKEYGWIKRGENPARDIQVPKRTAKDNKVSQTVRTILEAEVTPEEALPTIEKMIADGDFSYEVYGDKQAIKDAENFVKHRGWGDATREWFDRMKKGEVSKKNTAIGWTLYNNAVNSKDMETAIDILNAMVEHQRNAAQAVQATRILKKMSPEGQLYAAQKSVQRLQEELNERYGKKTDVELKIDPTLAEELMEAEDQKARDKVLQKIYKDIGRQMPSRFIDKWNAWRYLAMLGNPRTHVRNIVGNAFFAPVVATKNLTATAIESAVNRVTGGKTGRTKAVVGFSTEDKGRLKVAWADYADVAEAAMDGGKYSDSANANKYIQEGRQIFGRTDQAKTKIGRAVSGTVGKGAEAARTFNSKALEVEDRWFSQPHYAAALASYCKANGITAEQMKNGGITDEARAYAIKEAQKATYRDTNMLSDIFGRIGRYEGKNKAGKAISTVVEGILPFRKTPANILARGLEYSPLGLIKSISYDLVQVKNGDMNATQLIDNLSAGLTGTGLLVLGAFLAAQGLVRGAGGDDKEKKEFEDLMGHQNYALEIGGKSFTLDWLAPEALPFFVGVNLWEVGKESSDGRTLADWLTAISNVSEPMMEMSCLQSLNDVFDSVGYASSNGLSGLTSAAASAATSYLTQGIPTLLGQFERSAQGIRMTTYTDKNKKNLTGDMQYAIGSASGKIPGYDYNQIAYIDAWGRTESTGSMLERIFNNMANPSYVSAVDESKMEKELMRLYNSTSDSSVFPNRASKYFSVGGKRIDLNGAQYVSYAKKKGQTAYNLLADLTKSSAYAKLTDTDKAKAVGLVYDYANAVAKAHVSNYKLEGWIRKADKSNNVVSYILREKVGK